MLGTGRYTRDRFGHRVRIWLPLMVAIVVVFDVNESARYDVKSFIDKASCLISAGATEEGSSTSVLALIVLHLKESE